MPETKVSARDYILLADINNDGTFKPVACLTSNSLTSTNDTIDATWFQNPPYRLDSTPKPPAQKKPPTVGAGPSPSWPGRHRDRAHAARARRPIG